MTSSVLLATLYTAVLSDVMDEMGYFNEALRPLLGPSTEALSFMGRVHGALCPNALGAGWREPVRVGDPAGRRSEAW